MNCVILSASLLYSSASLPSWYIYVPGRKMPSITWPFKEDCKTWDWGGRMRRKEQEIVRWALTWRLMLRGDAAGQTEKMTQLRKERVPVFTEAVRLSFNLKPFFFLSSSNSSATDDLWNLAKVYIFVCVVMTSVDFLLSVEASVSLSVPTDDNDGD